MMRRGTSRPHSIHLEKTHHASGWKYFVSAPDSNRLHSVYETDALPNELACDFPPIAWCKLEGPGGRVHPGVVLVWRNQQFRLHDLLDHRALLAIRLRFEHSFERALHLVNVRELFDVHFRVRHAQDFRCASHRAATLRTARNIHDVGDRAGHISPLLQVPGKQAALFTRLIANREENQRSILGDTNAVVVKNARARAVDRSTA